MYWYRFDIVSAYYAYAVDYHSGQWSSLYKMICRISKYYRPGMSNNGYDSLSENAQAIYDRLVTIQYEGK
jgi:hypothetical protein